MNLRVLWCCTHLHSGFCENNYNHLFGRWSRKSRPAKTLAGSFLCNSIHQAKQGLHITWVKQQWRIRCIAAFARDGAQVWIPSVHTTEAAVVTFLVCGMTETQNKSAFAWFVKTKTHTTPPRTNKTAREDFPFRGTQKIVDYICLRQLTSIAVDSPAPAKRGQPSPKAPPPPTRGLSCSWLNSGRHTILSQTSFAPFNWVGESWDQAIHLFTGADESWGRGWSQQIFLRC